MAKAINLVLAGGGVKGIACVGAVTALQDAGYSFARIAGTSAGAVVGGLVAAGFACGDMKDILRDMPYEKLRDEGLLDRFGWPGKVASLLLEKGIYEGDFFCDWYAGLLGQKGVATFADLKDGDVYRLDAYAADITLGRLVSFPRDLAGFELAADEYPVALAVRASISIPFYYEPVTLKGNYLVDGGILSNFPFHAYKDDPLPTIGIKLSGRPDEVAKPSRITGPLSYASAVFNTMLTLQDQIHLSDKQAVEQTIFVDTGDIMATDFDLTKKQQQELYDTGYRAAVKYLERTESGRTAPL